ncbi:MAG: hypothetical protein JXR51_00810 [Bacteroidales bacterium]|nr:hypothetical protein [Bacteroidales bacterium]MBN2755682.1 hypothetical protein [Bacteroidales bacterium]
MTKLFSLALITIISLITDLRGCNDKVIAIYGYSTHLDSEGNPSRCDCDYYEYSLYLNQDYTFRYYYRNGRIKTMYAEINEGNWLIDENKLVLNIKSESLAYGQTINSKKKNGKQKMW